MTAAIVALIILGVLGYAWIGYPLLLTIFVRPRPDYGVEETGFSTGQSGPGSSAAKDCRPPERGECAPHSSLPRVAILFSAYNEEAHIATRLRNLLELNYPRDRVTILVGVDGQEDRTAELAREVAAENCGVRVLAFPERRGKVSVLKDLVLQAGAEEDAPPILVFTDANTEFQADALTRLTAPFTDPRVGGVCGRLIFVRAEEHPSAGTANPLSEGFYWQWETGLKIRESRLDSCLGANGAIFAIRRELFWREIPGNTIVDDFVIGMKVRERGYRMLYEQRAVAWEALPLTRSEWTRRVRIGAGAFQALHFCRRALLPRYRGFAWVFFSHKVLRWFTPHLLLVLLLAAAALAAGVAGPIAGWMAGMVLLALALISIPATVFGGRGERRGLLHLVSHFWTMQAAMLMGFFRFCRGDLKGTWERTPR